MNKSVFSARHICLLQRADYGNVFSTRSKRESGESPERSGHCNQGVESSETIGILLRRMDSVLICKSGNLLNSFNESFRSCLLYTSSEVIVDIVETGSTLRENGLKVLEEVCPLSARMVVNQVSMKMENERISKLIEDLRKVI